LYLTVSKWHGEGLTDEFDHCGAGGQFGRDDMAYASDPRRYMEVVLSSHSISLRF